ncbi:MAG TPA: hypothetical protein VM261_39260 [Kofleriaceae bacterium]|nr:hypothetical protein [Kofleriaceae bacterium]
MRLPVIASILSVLTISAIAACGGKSTPPGGGGGGGGGGGTGPEAPMTGPLAAGQWESMDHQARAKFMGDVVLPAMQAEFKAFDATEFAEINCKTCHGKGADDHSFEMPNADLPVLSMAFFQAPPDDKKAVLEFMSTKVKPQMATLLGLPERTETNEDGFGCMHCHTMKE